MIHQPIGLRKKSALVCLLTLLVSIYWFVAQIVNVYRFPPAGAIYELLWLFMLVSLFVLPVISFICWYKNKFSFGSPDFYTFLISVTSPIILVTQFP